MQFETAFGLFIPDFLLKRGVFAALFQLFCFLKKASSLQDQPRNGQLGGGVVHRCAPFLIGSLLVVFRLIGFVYFFFGERNDVFFPIL